MVKLNLYSGNFIGVSIYLKRVQFNYQENQFGNSQEKQQDMWNIKEEKINSLKIIKQLNKSKS